MMSIWGLRLASILVSIPMSWAWHLLMLTRNSALLIVLIVMTCLVRCLRRFEMVPLCTTPLASLIWAVSLRLMVCLRARRNWPVCRLHVNRCFSVVMIAITWGGIRWTSGIRHLWWADAAKLCLNWVSHGHLLLEIWIILMKILLFLDFFVFFVTSLTLVLCIFLGYRRSSPTSSTSEYSFISCLRIWHLKLWLILIRQVSLMNLWRPIISASFALACLLLTLVWC